MNISQLKRKYKNSWVLAEVIKADAVTNKPLDIRPILASHDRDEVYDRIAKVPKGTLVTTIYTGKLPTSYLLHVKNTI